MLLQRSRLLSSYPVPMSMLTPGGVDHNKEDFSPSPLDLSFLDGPSLSPKDSWRYLGFIFNKKLLFHNHIDFYTNKTISIVKYMKILSNSTRGLNPHQKCLLYRSCIMSIALYDFQL